MTAATTPRLTLRQRWQRLRTSPRFPFVLFFGLLVAGGLSQVYCYWWGVRIQRVVARNIGNISRGDLFPVWMKQSLGKYLEPLEPIRAVHLWVGNSTDRTNAGDDLRILRGTLFLRELLLVGNGSSSPESREQLGCLTQLRTLRLPVSHVTLADVAVVSKLPRLETLMLAGNVIGLDVYRQLAEMSQLKNLTITPFGAENISGLRELARSQSLLRLEGSFGGDKLLLAVTDRLPDGGSPLPNLRELRLRQSNITNDGLANLRNLTGLSHLDLSQTKVTSEGLLHLKSLPNLKTLYLAHCSITYQGAVVMAAMHNLESLNIESTSLSEESLMKLASLPRLRRFRITYASHEILSKVQHRLPPGCKFVHY